MRQAAKCSGEPHVGFEPEISECDIMFLRKQSERIGNAGNWNILVPAGKEINRDAVSKSDRTQRKANWILYRNV